MYNFNANTLPVLTKDEFAKYLEKVKETKRKKVTFYNGRVERHNRIGHILNGYRNKDMMPVKFTDIPLCEVDAEGNLVRRVTTDTQGVPRVSLFGQMVDFTNRASISFDPVLHYLVIKAIRDCEITSSTQKSEGLPKVNNGRIVELEPGVKEALEFQDSIKTLEAFAIVQKLRSNDGDALKKVYCAYKKLSHGEYILFTTMTGWAKSDPNKILSAFVMDEHGQYSQDIRLTDEALDLGVTNLALENGILERKRGMLYYDGKMVGSKVASVFIEFPEYREEIMAILELDSLLKKDKKAPAKKQANG